MSNRLSDKPELRMMVLPGESTGSDDAEQKADSAEQRLGPVEQRTDTAEQRADSAEQRLGPVEPNSGDERAARGADRYANAGPDCYWLEAG